MRLCGWMRSRGRCGRGAGAALVAALWGLAIAAAACRARPDGAVAVTEGELRAALAAHEDQFFEAMSRGDVEAMVEVYTDDAISLPPGAPLVRGKAALEEFWTRYLQGTRTVDTRHETVALERRGDLLCEVSTYEQTIHWEDGRVTRDSGKWVTIKKLQPDGSLRTHVGAWSSDLPPTPGE